ncbi:hypothetical protein MNBD_NITROSPIRAE02-361, partial [hydrothermal vent metagenome]
MKIEERLSSIKPVRKELYSIAQRRLD